MTDKKINLPIIIALLIITTLCTSCVSFSQSVGNQQNSEVGATGKPVIQNETELERNKRTWIESNIKNYKITFESNIAGALYTTLSPVEIEVHEGKATSIKHLAENEKSISIEEAKDNYGLLMYGRLKVNTVEGMFDLIKQAEEGKTTAEGLKTRLLEVEYDPKYGYPTKIKFDKFATDSYIFLQVKKFEIIE